MSIKSASVENGGATVRNTSNAEAGHPMEEKTPKSMPNASTINPTVSKTPSQSPANTTSPATPSVDLPTAAKKQLKTTTLDTLRCVMHVAILFSINLLNYMDRYTIAGVLTDLQTHFSMNDAQAGLLQTVFIIFFMVFAPICGFLGDRYNRKMIMVIGLLIWVSAVLASSFIPRNGFWVFAFLRGTVGIGEASYSIIAPTIIGDLFTAKMRSRILMLFYFAIPIGSGLGFIAGSMAASMAGGWQWGVRVTPPLGLLSVICLILFIEEPKRGMAENVDGAEHKATSYWEDLKYLIKIKSYIWTNIAYTSLIFVVGTIVWWAPTAISHSVAAKQHLNTTAALDSAEKDSINLIFGVITCLSGFLGVSTGVILAQMWKDGRFCFRGCATQSADAIVSGVGSLLAVPLLFLGYFLIDKNLAASWLVLFFAVLALCLNWSIVIDMLMYIILPHRRNVAISWLILLSHLFGDASGPYLIGLLSDWLRSDDDSPAARFGSLLYAFYAANVLLVLSGLAFFMAAYFLSADIQNYKSAMTGNAELLALTPRELSVRKEAEGTVLSARVIEPNISLRV